MDATYAAYPRSERTARPFLVREVRDYQRHQVSSLIRCVVRATSSSSDSTTDDFGGRVPPSAWVPKQESGLRGIELDGKVW